MSEDNTSRWRKEDVKKVIAEVLKEHPNGIDKDELAGEVARRFKRPCPN